MEITDSKEKQKNRLLGRAEEAAARGIHHTSVTCAEKPPPPPPLLSVPKIDGSRLAVPARHPVPHMLAAMFSHPALFEADTEMRHLNTYCPHTLDLCCAGCMSSLFQECVIYVTPIKNILLHHIHLNECDLAAPLPPS